MRRFETERPAVRAIVKDGTAWAALNAERLPGLVLTLGCLLLLLFLFSDSRFFVYGVQVKGDSSLPADAVYQASGVDAHSVFFIAPSQVAQRLLAGFPSLKTARVALGLPAQVSIHLEERQAQFVWQAGGQAYLVDERGTVVGTGDAPPSAVLIRCSEGCAPPDEQALDTAVLDTAMQLSQILGGQRSFDYSPRFGVSVRTEQGWLVHFGVGGDLAQKVAVMQSLQAELASNGIQAQFLDVGVPSRPYYR
jgi:cell division septal protein FtsQ